MCVYIVCYALCMLLSHAGWYLLSGIVLLFSAFALFCAEMRGPGLPVRLRALFSLGFVGGQALSCMKLSRLQTDWEPAMWCTCFVAFVVFWVSVEWGRKSLSMCERKKDAGHAQKIDGARLLIAIFGITVISWMSFLLESSCLGYIPLLLRGVPHAYSYFHVRGIHYFTVSAVLVPAFSIIWLEQEQETEKRKRMAVMLCSLFSLLLPILCVSRFQLLLSVFTAIATRCIVRRGQISIKKTALVLFILIFCYVLLTVARSHSIRYLNGIFEMKYRLPIFISQPYIYIANNYDNLNCLIRDLPCHSFGMRMLFPLFALSGLKFKIPALTAFPLYVTKEELTTLTLFYDAWYDFGVSGVAAFSALLAMLVLFMEKHLKEAHHPLFCVFYAQLSVYLTLSFFTTWFSNPATWFYFIEIVAVALFVTKRRHPI